MSFDIALEGLDLSGKSTLAKQLAYAFKARHVGEPFTETLHSKQVKEMITQNQAPKVYEIMALIAQRVEANQKVKHPYLSRGRDIISDRCVVSSMVYQSSEEADQATVLKMNESILNSYGYSAIPDILVFIDLDYETYMERCNNGTRVLDNKEIWLQNPTNFEAQRQKYLDAIELLSSGDRRTVIITIKPAAPVEEVIGLIKEAMTVIE